MQQSMLQLRKVAYKTGFTDYDDDILHEAYGSFSKLYCKSKVWTKFKV